MKKTLLVAAVVAGTCAANAQGLINFNNSSSAATKISVNSVAGGAATGLASGAAGTYYYALFYSKTSSTVAGSAGPLIPTATTLGGTYVPNDPAWNFSGLYATSSATAGRVTGSTSGVVTGVGAAASANFVVVGWSASIGNNINSLTSFLGNPYSGPLLGESTVYDYTLGDGATVPTPAAFGGSTIPGFTLGIVNVPEPTTIALGVIGGLSLLGLRRKKA